MKTSLPLLLALALALAAGARPSPAAQAGKPPKPNIVFLVADDLGWSDVGWHGSEIKTPNLDRLAASGAKLEQHYVQPVCSPTRAALLTGRYPMRHGLQVGVVRPHAQYGLPLEERTLPQALKEAGYATSICGKWHLGHFQRAYLPTSRGFDHQYGHYNGALDYFTHIRDGGFDWHRDDKVCRDEGYSTALLGDEAVRRIESRNPAKPLFLYVPFNAVHSPLQALPEHLKLYEGIANPRRRAYAAMLHAMDEQVGRIVAAVEKAGQSKNTLFVFSSDNGGPLGLGATNRGLRAGKGTVYEGGVRVAACASWAGRIRPGTVVNEPVHMVDWYPTLLGLAGASLKQPLPLDGKDILPVVADGKPSPHAEILLNTTPRNGAIRMGKWKLVLNGRFADEADGAPLVADGERLELFDLQADPGEQTNLAEMNPEKVRELRARLDAYAKQAIPPKSHAKPAGFVVPAVWGEGS